MSTTGIGITLDFLDLGSVAAYLTWRLDQPNTNGQVIGIDLEFGMRLLARPKAARVALATVGLSAVHGLSRLRHPWLQDIRRELRQLRPLALFQRDVGVQGLALHPVDEAP